MTREVVAENATTTEDSSVVRQKGNGWTMRALCKKCIVDYRAKVADQATTKDFLVVQTEGKHQVRRNIKLYNEVNARELEICYG